MRALVLVSTLVASAAHGSPLDLVPQIGHQYEIRSVALSPDGKLAATAEKQIKLWDAETGLLIRNFGPVPDVVQSLAFSPDGRRLASATYKMQAHIWDVATGIGTAIEPGCLAVQFTATNALLCGSLTDVTEIAGGSRAQRVTLPQRAYVTGFSGDGQHVLFHAQRQMFRQRLDGSPPTRLLETTGEIDSAASSHDGSLVLIALANDPRRVVLADASGVLRTLASAPDATSDAKAVAISADGRRGVSGHVGGKLRFYNLATGAITHEVSANDRTIDAAAFSRTGDRVLTGGWDMSARQWDVATAVQLTRFRAKKTYLRAIDVASDGRSIVVALSSGTLVSWDVVTLRPRWSLANVRANRLAIAPRGKRALVAGDDGDAIVIDLERGDVQRRLATGKARGVAWLDDRRGLVLVERRLLVVDVETGAVVVEHPAPEYSDDVRVLAGGEAALVQRVGSERVVVDMKTGGTTSLGTDVVDVTTLADGRRLVLASHWSPANTSPHQLEDFATRTPIGPAGDAKYLPTTLAPDARRVLALRAYVGTATGIKSQDRSVIDVVDLATWKVERSLQHPSQIDWSAFSRDGAFAFTATTDGIVRITRLATGRGVWLYAADGEWIAYDDDGYFDASRRGGAYLAAVRATTAHPVDQLAVRNNRPDILLGALGLAPREMVAHFAARHEQRLARLGFVRDQLEVDLARAPLARIVDVQRDRRTATLTFDLEAPGGLRSYQVHVNGVPVFAAKPTSGRKQRIVERFELGAGRNEIEASALDNAGVESLRVQRVVDVSEPVRGDVYFLGIGISRYARSTFDLKYPHKDVLDLADLLRRSSGMVHVETLVDEQATVANLRAASAFVRRAGVDDTLVILLAGHGLHARDAEARYYFATHEVDPNDLAKTAADFETIEELVQSSPSRKKLVLVDTCESGEREDGEVRVAPTRGMQARTTRALAVVSRAQRPRPFLLDRDRFIYTDLARRSGAIVLSSSRGDEVSWESDELENGVFTQEILVALATPAGDLDSDGTVSTDELRTHVARAVSARTGGRQHPTVDRDNLAVRISLPSLPAARDIIDRPAAALPIRARPPRGCGCASSPDGSLFALFAIALYVRRRKRATV